MKWAHPPVPYTIICVSGKWLAITCKCTIPYTSWDMNYFLVWILVQWRTDRRTDRQKAMHMSPPCISTGVLKNLIHAAPIIYTNYSHYIHFPLSQFVLKWKCPRVDAAPTSYNPQFLFSRNSVCRDRWKFSIGSTNPDRQTGRILLPRLLMQEVKFEEWRQQFLHWIHEITFLLN